MIRGHNLKESCPRIAEGAVEELPGVSDFGRIGWREWTFIELAKGYDIRCLRDIS